METTHSKTRRAKGSSPKIVVQSWDSVWDSFKESRTKTTTEDMEADGWKLAILAAKEVGLSRQAMFDLISKDMVESTKKKIDYSGKTREMVFVRPKTTICQ
jgi:hypothetical protein